MIENVLKQELIKFECMINNEGKKSDIKLNLFLNYQATNFYS